MTGFVRRHWFGLLLLAALLARLPQLAMPYWYDEAWTEWVTALPWARMWAAVAGDVHPAGYFVATWGIVQVAPWAIRLLPLACSLAAIPLAREIARALELPVEVQVVTTLLMALSPWSVYFGAELRAYSALECAVLAAWLCVLRRRWWLLGTCFFAILNLHDLGGIYCAVIGIYALWQERRTQWWRPILSGAGALAAFAPQAVILVHQMLALKGGYWIPRPDLADALLTPYEFLALGASGTLTVCAMAATVVLVLLIAARRQSSLLVTAAAAPAAAAFVISWVATPVYLNRTLIGCAPFFYILAAQVITSCRGYGRIIVAAAALPLAAVLAVSPARDLLIARYQSAQIASLIRSDAPDLPVWHLGPGTLVDMHQYNLPNPQHLQPGFDSINAGHYSAETMAAMGVDETPISITGKTWLVVPKDETRTDVAGLCREYHCRKLLDYVDPEPVYGVEVYQVWP